jgi:hypothetical protein
MSAEGDRSTLDGNAAGGLLRENGTSAKSLHRPDCKPGEFVGLDVLGGAGLGER